MTMIEKVAIAIAKHLLALAGDHETYKTLDDQSLAFYRKIACVAIETMREPNEAMKNAPLGKNDKVSGFLDMYDETQIWRAMIDAALSETQMTEARKIMDEDKSLLKKLKDE